MWEALEATALAQHLRASTYSYPLVNALHIVGLALLLGGITPVDLRLLGLWRGIPLEPLIRTARRTAAFGLVLALAMGLLLFSVRASEYAMHPAFQIKLVLILAALANAAFGEHAHRRHEAGRLRVHAGLSLGLWLAVILAGRAIAYF
ncbi:MAG TPA: hypothetical protein VKA18_08095 [Alphaproteobacteria bacterium]|nr:hypothetical protein [Alphaproteobacteria bacterium]